jgi:hypothetical protein
MLGVEAIRTTQAKFGKKPLTGEQVRWGLVGLDLTADRIKHLGFEGVLRPIKMSCADHEGAHTARIQTWDGKSWKITSDWHVSDDSVIAPMVHRGRRQVRGREEVHEWLLHDALTHAKLASRSPGTGAAAKGRALNRTLASTANRLFFRLWHSAMVEGGPAPVPATPLAIRGLSWRSQDVAWTRTRRPAWPRK